ncbi:MAG: caspase family protein [Ekhidna sp.]
MPIRLIIFILFVLQSVIVSSQEYQMRIDPQGHSGKIHELLFTPDNRLISLSEDKSIQIWDIETQTVVDKFFAPLDLGPEGMIYAATIDHKGQHLAYSGYIKKDDVFAIVLLDLTTKKESVIVDGHSAPISSIQFSKDGDWLASGDLNGEIIIWQKRRDDFKEYARLTVEGTVNDMDFALHSPMLAIASESKFLTLYDIDDQEQKQVERHYMGVSTVEYTSDSLYFVTGGKDGFLNLFSAKGKFLQKLDQLANPITSISISKDSQIIVAMTEGKGVGKTYSLPDGKLQATFVEHDNTALSSAISPVITLGAFQVASAGGNNNQIMIWNPFSGRLTSILNGDGMSVWNLSFSDSTTLLIGNSSESAKYNYAFDFSAQNLVTIDQTVKEVKGSTKTISPFKLKNSDGISITNDEQIDGRILTVCEGSNGDLFIGSDFSLKKYDKEGKFVKEYIGHESGVRAITVSPNGKMLFTASEDQKIIGWSLESDSTWEEPLMSLFLTRSGEWVMWSKYGYYSSSPQGAKYLGWKTATGHDAETSFFTVDQYFEVLFRPKAFLEAFRNGEMVETVLERGGERKFDLANLNKPSLAFFGKPYVNLSKGKSQYLNRRATGATYTTDRSPVTFESTLYDRGGGIKEFKVYHNDKLALIQKNISEKEERRIEKEFELPLLQGVNKIEIVATNFQNIDSKPHRLDIEYTGETSAISDLYVFVIGINEYENPSYNLNYAYADAKSFSEKIIKNSDEIYNEVFVTEIYNKDATLENIESKMREVQEKASLQDVFIFYYAGHGTVDEVNNSDYYLVPSNVTQLYGDSKQLQKSGISAGTLKEWLASVRAQKQLVLLDACHSGEAVQTFAARGISSEERAIVQLARSSGTVLISASGSKQFATEFQELKHGAFTYALLEALDGKADGGDLDKKITVNEIKAYMEDRVPDLTKQYGGGNAQYPTGFSTGQDFPVLVLKK